MKVYVVSLSHGWVCPVWDVEMLDMLYYNREYNSVEVRVNESLTRTVSVTDVFTTMEAAQAEKNKRNAEDENLNNVYAVLRDILRK